MYGAFAKDWYPILKMAKSKPSCFFLATGFFPPKTTGSANLDFYVSTTKKYQQKLAVKRGPQKKDEDNVQHDATSMSMPHVCPQVSYSSPAHPTYGSLHMLTQTCCKFSAFMITGLIKIQVKAIPPNMFSSCFPDSN